MSRIRRSSVRQGTVIVRSQTWPSQPPAPAGGRDEGGRGGRDGRVRGVDLERDRALRVARGGLERASPPGRGHGCRRKDPRRAGLRLERDHTRAEPAEGRDAVADMGADVEGEIACAERTAHRARPWRGCAPDHRDRCARMRGRWPPRDASWRAPRQAPRAQGADLRAAVRTPRERRRVPRRARSAPRRGEAVITAKGIGNEIAERQRQAPEERRRARRRERAADRGAEQERRPEARDAVDPGDAVQRRAPARSRPRSGRRAARHEQGEPEGRDGAEQEREHDLDDGAREEASPPP